MDGPAARDYAEHTLHEVLHHRGGDSHQALPKAATLADKTWRRACSGVGPW